MTKMIKKVIQSIFYKESAEDRKAIKILVIMGFIEFILWELVLTYEDIIDKYIIYVAPILILVLIISGLALIVEIYTGIKIKYQNKEK